MHDAVWIPDVLGAPFEQRTLPLGADAEGDVVATLVRLRPARPPWWSGSAWTLSHRLRDVDVLYVHGWSDYFFQRRLARFWSDRGATFYALDLRKYGRSLRPGQTPGFVTDLTTYDEDIAAALAAMGRTDAGDTRRLVLMGHSTGGLTLSLWAARHPELVTAVVLNSPWLTLQLSAGGRRMAAPLISAAARFLPTDAVPQLDLGFYTRAQHEVADPADPMQIDTAWRPERTMPVLPAWLNAVTLGQKRVQAGLDIQAPVCVLLSRRSAVPTHWSDEMTRTDTVLWVDHIAEAALRLGRSITVERIDGALHDVFLSAHEPRNDAYGRLERFAESLVTRTPRRANWLPGAKRGKTEP